MEPQHRPILLSGLIAAVVGLAAGFLGGRLAPAPAPPAPAALRAALFQLVDQSGRERGRLCVDEAGVAKLTLGDADAPLVSLAADPRGGARLELADSQHRPALEVNAAPQGSRTVSLYQEGKLRLGLEVQNNGDPALKLYDKANPVISLSLTPQGDPHLLFSGPAAKPALEMIAKKNGDRSLSLFGLDGVARVVLGLKDNKKAALGLFDPQGKTRVALMDEPSLIFLKGGKLVRTVP